MLANVANTLYWNTKLYAGLAAGKIKSAFAKTERGDHLVEVLGTILVALVLLAIFREQLIEAINDVMDNLSDRFGELFGDASAGAGAGGTNP